MLLVSTYTAVGITSLLQGQSAVGAPEISTVMNKILFLIPVNISAKGIFLEKFLVTASVCQLYYLSP
jgi:hypothetical protein